MKGVLKIVLLFVVFVSMIVGCGFDSIFVIFFGEIGFWDLGDEWDSDVGGVDDFGVFIDFGVQDMDVLFIFFDMFVVFDLVLSGDFGVVFDMNVIDMNVFLVEDMGQEFERDQGIIFLVDFCVGQDRFFLWVL